MSSIGIQQAISDASLVTVAGTALHIVEHTLLSGLNAFVFHHLAFLATWKISAEPRGMIEYPGPRSMFSSDVRLRAQPKTIIQ